MDKTLRFGIVAGEASGDLLGAGLIRAIRRRWPDAEFEGIAGPQMIAAGARSLFPMERLSVMGIVEVLGRYRELLGIRRQLADHFRQHPPDAFIGIDAPDFTLGLERQLREVGIKTAHYVSPSVWAWRPRRVKKIARSTDLMLTLFPFEAHFYEAHRVPVRFVGHPLADTIPLEVDRAAARQALSLPVGGEILALLPGSRYNELHYLSGIFIETVRWLRVRRPGLHVVVPLVDATRRTQFEQVLANIPDAPPMTLLDGQSREVMAAADVVLLASGTAALEAMLLKRPMVVAYKLALLTYWLVRYRVRVQSFSLPNLLAGASCPEENRVPELIQHQAKPERLGAALLAYLENPQKTADVNRRFNEIHQTLRRDANCQAAEAILDLAGAKEMA